MAGSKQAAGAAIASAPGKDEKKLAEYLDLQRTRVICGPEMNYHVNTVTSAMAYMAVGYDNSWDHAKWADDFEIKVTKMKDDMMEVELINIDPSLVNTLRRILISEVPTVAIEHVFVVDNTSIMQEEVLSHRLGLVPLTVDPEALQWKEEKATEANTIVLKLHVECSKGKDGKYVNDRVYSSHLQWLPAGSEYPDETGTRFASPQARELAVKPTVHDILLCKLNPGQCIELEAHAIKGQGWDHAKWSPVATAWHRMYPEVAVLKKIPSDVAQELASEVPEVFKLTTKKSGNVKLSIEDVRHHEDKLERIRHLTGLDRFKEYIEVRKKKEHFILTIESVGAVAPEKLFLKAISILKEKCTRLNAML